MRFFVLFKDKYSRILDVIILICNNPVTLLIKLLIREGIEDNSKIFFLILNENICCDLSLEPSQRDGSKDGSQNKFYDKNMDNYPKIIPVTPYYLEHCC